MASCHFRVNSGKKGGAREHAAYIVGDGKYRVREDVVYTTHGNLPDWAENDPYKFFGAADRGERANAAVYREYVIALPNELSAEQNSALMEKLVRKLVGDKPYLCALHAPEGTLSGISNPHSHIMFSDRVADGVNRPPEKWFARHNAKKPELGGCRKDSGGKTRMQIRDALLADREAAANVINQVLKEHGVDARIDHRSLREQGKDREAERRLSLVRIKGMSREAKAQHVALRMSRQTA